MLLRELEGRLEEVHEQPGGGIQLCQSGRRRHAFEPAIPDKPAHHRSVLLLDKGLVVLPVGTTAGERDLRCRAIIPHRLVDEHAVVVGVEAEQRERQPLAQLVQHPISSVCSRTSSGAHSVQPLAISVITSVQAKLPLATGPL